MEQIPQWISYVMYAVYAFWMICGSLICLGRIQVSKVLPKEHILNRAYGASWLMSGAGMLLAFLGENNTLQWPLWVVAMFLLLNSGVLILKLNIEVRRLAKTA